MKNFAPLFGLILSAACATAPIKVPSRPDLPDRIATQEEAANLAEAYKLVCEDSTCKRADGSYELPAARQLAHGYGEPTQVPNNADYWSTGIDAGIGLAAFFGAFASYAFAQADAARTHSDFYAAQDERGYRGMGTLFSILSGATGAITAVVWALMPDSDEEFAAAYNKALEKDIAARVKPEPTQVAQAH